MQVGEECKTKMRILMIREKKKILIFGKRNREKNYMFLELLERMVKLPTAKLGLAIFVIIIFACIFAPLFTPYGVNDLNIAERFQGPNKSHIMGTDELGRDIFTRILYGGRNSLGLGFAASTFSLVLAVIIGSIAGYFGGKVESSIMRFMDIWSALPQMLLAILISSALGMGFFNTVLALGIGGIPAGVRMIRGQILRERSAEYLEAAESINCSKISIMFKHMLPNVISPMIIAFTMNIGANITLAAGLSYIGLGIQPPTPEWGSMLSGARSHMTLYPYLIAFPGLAIALTILATNLLGDGLRDALDPRLRK